MKSKYRLFGAYDSETTNYTQNGTVHAFPILHQLGLIDCDISELTPANVEAHTNIILYRHTLDLYSALDEIIETDYGFVPVIVCHNLAFDMYALSSFIGSHKVKVLAKSCRKPITFTFLDDKNNARLVIWDSLIFSQMPLSKMGDNCGYPKLSGKWDYSLIRTPDTPLTADELAYAKHDIYCLLCWFSWWIKRNPDIEPEKLGLNVVTKTGIVRERRRKRFDQVKGRGHKYNIGRYWLYTNRTEAPKSDDELYTMIAAMRGGFTFCASEHASYPYDLTDSDCRVYGFDATSMHPSEIVSHFYPVNFHHTSTKALELAFELVSRVTFNDLLEHYDKPFSTAFYACFAFVNLRPKKGSLYAKHGIYPLASARFTRVKYELNEDNQDNQEFIEQSTYKDYAENPIFAFGKLISADYCEVYLTELAAYEVCLAYDYDEVKAIDGYMTSKFMRPTDMATVSVMQFYSAKNLYKEAREEYYSTGRITNGDALRKVSIPENIISAMETGALSDSDVEMQYLSLKSDLNSLFGIEATNEYRRSTIIGKDGIEYTGGFGICNAPKNSKAWYQFGQRIVGWSRIAQHIAMHLVEPYSIDIINGDTDSLKVMAKIENKAMIIDALGTLGKAIDDAKANVCKRVKASYAKYYDVLDGIGHYVLEFEADRFCASWNKAYCEQNVDKRDGKRHFAITLAGIPTKRGIVQFADELYENGMSFAEIVSNFLGYNVTFGYDMIGLNARSFPEWEAIVNIYVKDYLGNESHVIEPASLALYPMSKTVNDTSKLDNAYNIKYAIKNNSKVNERPLLISAGRLFGGDNGY